MARLIEFLCFLFIVYLFYRRLAAPFRRGFDARERERNRERERERNREHERSEAENLRRSAAPDREKEIGRIDRSNVEDAEFKDLP